MTGLRVCDPRLRMQGQVRQIPGPNLHAAHPADGRLANRDLCHWILGLSVVILWQPKG